ncbi:hypothetical protein JXL21_06605 [Candidatus Bathyarchaeota archaeon]|nr:hypothetical protein [Candidatus Bathyarchaeota archaeon]
MREVHLAGSYYDMGLAYGKMLKETGFRPPAKSEKERILASECREVVEETFPEVIDEIRGVSDASGLDYGRLSDFILVHPMMSRAPGCTSFAVSRGGETWTGRNYDMYYWLKESLESYYTEPEGGYRSLGQTDILVGREDGVNEKGLHAALHGVPSCYAPGVHFWISVRYILDRCSDVEEAVGYLEETRPHCGFMVLLADRSGTMAVAEIHPEKTRVRWAEEDCIVATNHLNHPEMLGHTVIEPPDSRPRYQKCVEELGKVGDVDDKMLQGILSGHDGLVCSHLDEHGVGTLYSTVTSLDTLRVWRAVDHPCSNPYRLDERLKRNR